VSGHSILYLGRGGFATEYLTELATLPCCTLLTRSNELRLPADTSYIDLILLDADAMISLSDQPLSELIRSLEPYPVVALTQKKEEHRGIAAVKAGAQAYICVDDITVEGQDFVFEHAVSRARLQQRLSDTDVSVLSILRDINDGVIVVDEDGLVLDINPAARTILGLGARMQPDPTWEQTFCCIDGDGASYRNAHELPLVRARGGEKFADQIAIYRTPEQPDAILSINGQGLYDGNRELIGGVITFRDITEIAHRTSELERLARFLNSCRGLSAAASGRAHYSPHCSSISIVSSRSTTPLVMTLVMPCFASSQSDLRTTSASATFRVAGAVMSSSCASSLSNTA
jgi:PAS domain-containing protein